MPIIITEFPINTAMERTEYEDSEAAQPQPQAILYGGLNDGTMAISFSHSDLEVHADFNPSVLGGKPLDLQAVAEILHGINVLVGICWDNIQQALDECNTTRRKVRGVLVAKGERPEAEIAEYFEMNPLLAKPHREIDSNARINYREFSPFTIVKKGQVLAKLKPRKPGKEGKDVHGTALPFGTIHPEGVVGGDNTVTDADKITAAIHGQFIQSRNVLSVQEHLVIKGGVGYATGHIVFPGDVKINGPVSDGFKIYSGGSLHIKQTLDLTEVVTKGDIVVAGGIIGKGVAILKSGGEIKTKFIENCRVAARNSVLVESEIINSSIFALGTVQMGEKGTILGGDIYSVHGLRAGGIGKKGGKSTRIHCGINFTAQQEMEKHNNKLRILAAKLARLQGLMAEPGMESEKMTAMEELVRRLEGEQQTASAHIGELMGNINVDENAIVEILGEIAPGTLIEICQVALFVDEPLHKVCVRLDKANGKLVADPL